MIAKDEGDEVGAGLDVTDPTLSAEERETLAVYAKHSSAYAPHGRLWRAFLAAEERAKVLEEDAKIAAGECLVPLPEPGTDLSRVLLANRQLHRQRTAAEERAKVLEESLMEVMEGHALTIATACVTEGDGTCATRGPCLHSQLLTFLNDVGDKGKGWIARHSSTGRGFRLHQPGPHATPMDALNAAVAVHEAQSRPKRCDHCGVETEQLTPIPRDELRSWCRDAGGCSERFTAKARKDREASGPPKVVTYV